MYSHERMAEWIAKVIGEHCMEQGQTLNVERATCLALACLRRNSEEAEAVRNEEIMSSVR